MARSARRIPLEDPLAEIGEARPSERRCDVPGCAAAGEFRAPKGRDALYTYYWFCLDHVREYNRGWDYYAGMSEREIEAHLRDDVVWQRPTWPLGRRSGGPRHERMADPFDLFAHRVHADPTERGHGGAGARNGDHGPQPTPHDRALAVFELAAGATKSQIKARYKELVKRHHPDRHGGDKAAEERLKAINEAYATLRQSAAF